MRNPNYNKIIFYLINFQNLNLDSLTLHNCEWKFKSIFFLLISQLSILYKKRLVSLINNYQSSNKTILIY